MDPRPWIGHLLRQIRRDVDASQRELARLVGVPKSTLADAEAGRADITLRRFLQILDAVGYRVSVQGADGQSCEALWRNAREVWRDRGGRRFPAHLDVNRRSPEGDGEWATMAAWIKPPPEATYHLDRLRRDHCRVHGWFGVDGKLPWVPRLPDPDEVARAFPPGHWIWSIPLVARRGLEGWSYRRGGP